LIVGKLFYLIFSTPQFLKMKRYKPATAPKWTVFFFIITFIFSAYQKQIDRPSKSEYAAIRNFFSPG